MLSRIALIALLGTLVAWPAVGLAQSDGVGLNTLDVGGVSVPVPAENPASAPILTPGEPMAGPQDEPEGEAAETTDAASGESETSGRRWQSTRVSSVSVSNNRDRFLWFYPAHQLYTGIIPAIRDSLPHIAPGQTRGAQARRPNEVTWIGFQPLNDRTRVFVQTARAADYDVTEEEDGLMLIISLDQTRLSLTNFARFMDTRFFGRAVNTLDAEQVQGGGTRIVIALARQVPYSVTSSEGYLYIDFQDVGDW